MSYSTWRDNKSGNYEFGNFIESLWTEGYKPLIMLDSGAYTFRFRRYSSFYKKGGPGIKQKVIYWVNEILYRYPNIKFHLFGSQDNQILDKLLPNIYSADGSAWIRSAGFRYDRKIEGDKLRKAIENITRKDIA